MVVMYVTRKEACEILSLIQDCQIRIGQTDEVKLEKGLVNILNLSKEEIDSIRYKEIQLVTVSKVEKRIIGV